MVKPKPLATVEWADGFGRPMVGGMQVCRGTNDRADVERVAASINRAHEAATEQLRGQLAAAREALKLVRRAYRQGHRGGPAPDAVEAVLAAIDADEPFVPKRLLDEAEARMRETDRQLEQSDPYKRGFEAGLKADGRLRHLNDMAKEGLVSPAGFARMWRTVD